MRLAMWTTVLLLALALGLRLVAPTRSASGFATLPILTPTSLAYEASMRAQRGQPAGMGGAEALELAQALLSAPPPQDPTLAAEIEALAQERQGLLALRDQRHGLNIRLMDVGVEVARRLTPEQWEAIHMRRDQLKAQAEAATFERLLRRLQGPAPRSSTER